MMSGLTVGLGLLMGVAQRNHPPTMAWKRGGWHASATTPGEDHDVWGYALGMAHRGERGSFDLDLSRELYPLGETSEQVRVDAQGRTHMAGGLLIDDADDEGVHHVELQLDRTAWLDLQQSTTSTAYDHGVAQSVGLSVRYGKISAPDRPVRTAAYFGAGLQRSFALRSAHDGSKNNESSASADSARASWSDALMEGELVSHARDLSSLDFGRHRAAAASGVSLSAQVRVECPLFADIVDGRLDSILEVSQLETGALTVGDTLSVEASRQSSIRSQTRLSARFVGWESAVVPSIFVDINTLTWLDSLPGEPIQPVVGIGLTRGGA